MATAVITGASGLLGAHVANAWDVEGLHLSPVNSRETDLLPPGQMTDLVARLRPTVVVHLAWSASGTPGYRSSPDNDRWVHATVELAAACRDAGVWLLATGTPLDRVTGPADAYARSKTRLRQLLEPAISSGEVTWLRPFYVVDPHRRRPALVDQALEAGSRGRPVALRTPDDAHDFVHAADVGRAVVDVVRSGSRGEVPIGSGRLHRVRDLVDALGVAWERAPGAEPAPPRHDPAADISRLRELGWAPVLTKELFHDD